MNYPLFYLGLFCCLANYLRRIFAETWPGFVHRKHFEEIQMSVKGSIDTYTNGRKFFFLNHCLVESLTYTKTIKYPTVCPIYLIKWPLFDWSQKYINVTKHPPILLYKLKYIWYWSPRSLSAKFSPPLKLQESKVENRKKWPFY